MSGLQATFLAVSALECSFSSWHKMIQVAVYLCFPPPSAFLQGVLFPLDEDWIRSQDAVFYSKAAGLACARPLIWSLALGKTLTSRTCVLRCSVLLSLSHFSPLLISFYCSLSDPWHKIPALDPEKLNVFRTVREITGEKEGKLHLLEGAGGTHRHTLQLNHLRKVTLGGLKDSSVG